MATDIRTYGAVPDGTTDAASAINTAIAAGDIIIQNGVFLISESIIIPSNRTVYIKNAKIKLANNALDTMFRNSDMTNGNTNINIIGQGNAVLDGNAANNNDSYATYTINGDESYKYNFIMLYRVNTFQVKNIYIADRAHYAFFISQSSNGVLENIYMNLYTVTANQDGIDFLYGVSNISVTNLKGHSADDFMAFGALTPVATAAFNPHIGDYLAGDVHDITVSDVVIHGSSNGSLCAVVAGSGKKIYNINISDVVNFAAGSVFYYAYQSWRAVAPAKTDVYDITIDNIIVNSNARTYLCEVGDPCQDITISNLTDNSGKADYYEAAALDVDRFLINGIDQS